MDRLAKTGSMISGTMATRLVLITGLASVMAMGSGCIISVNGDSDGYGHRYQRVTSREMDSIVQTNNGLVIGMDIDDALSRFSPSRIVSLKNSSIVDGHRVEEWRAKAYNKHHGVSFERWLYFVDGRLASFGDNRVDYHLTGLVQSWAEEID